MLTLSGTGVFANTNNLTLNVPESSLKLNGISKVDNVSISAALTTGKLEIAQNSTIENLAHSGSSRIDIDNAKVLTLSNAFEIPQGKLMELVGTGGGILSLTETLKLKGNLQFSAPDYSLINGILELNDGSLLDVDYHTIIDSDIVLLGNTTVDVAQGVSLEYRGNAMDLLNYQLTFLGSGTFLNTNAILLSDSGSLLILAGDITIVLIEVTGNSAAGKGIRVESAGASVTNLNLLADMGLTFIDDAYVLNVENLNVNSPAQLTGDGNGGWLKVLVLGQNTANDKLTLHDINVSVEDEIDVYFEGQIVMTGNTIFDSIGGLTFNLNGAMNFNGTVNANINLNQGIMCITDNTTLVGNILHRADSLIYIAPEAVLTYQGTNPLNVNNMTLAIQGGGRFSSWDNNSLTMNEDGGTLRLADNGTTLSHLAFGEIVTNAVLDIEKNEDSICSGDNIGNDSDGNSSKILVENLDHAGDSNLKLSDKTELSLSNSFSVPNQRTMTVSGENGTLALGGTVTFNSQSQFILNSNETEVSGVFDFTNENTLDAQQSVNFKSSSSKWKNSQIKVTEGATLEFTDNQWQTQGTLTKTGGSMSLNNVVWRLSDDTSYSSNTEIETKTLLLNNNLLTLGTAGSDISVKDNMTFENSSEQINTGLADLSLEGGLILEEGKITSTGGIVYLEKGGKQSGGILDISDSTLKLGESFTKTAGTLTTTDDGTILELMKNLTVSSDSSINFYQVALNNNTLTLGSESTDLQVSSALTLDNINERVMTGAADLSLLAFQDISIGGVTSTGGTISLLAGGQLSGTGKLDVSGST